MVPGSKQKIVLDLELGLLTRDVFINLKLEFEFEKLSQVQVRVLKF